MSALDPEMQEDAMAMTALLQLAEALDFADAGDADRAAGKRGRRPGRGDAHRSGGIGGRLTGDRPRTLWYELFGQELVFIAEGSADAGAQSAQSVAPETQAPPDVTPAKPISSDEPMSEAGRNILAFHFGRMVANEEGRRGARISRRCTICA